MELETKLGPSSKEVAEDLQSHEIIRVQVLQKLNLWRSNFSYDFLQSVSMTANEKLPSHTYFTLANTVELRQLKLC